MVGKGGLVGRKKLRQNGWRHVENEAHGNDSRTSKEEQLNTQADRAEGKKRVGG